MEASGSNTAFEEDSRAMPPPPADRLPPLDISFSPEEVCSLEKELHRLTQHSVICKVFGSQPEMRDLLHGTLQTDVGAINDVQMMGRGFYYIEFANQETRDKVLASNPLNLRGAQAICSPWQHSFNTEKEMGKISKLTIILSGLLKE